MRTPAPRAILRAILNAARESEPLDARERRLVKLLILFMVAGTWLAIATLHSLPEEQVTPVLRNTANWV